MQEKVQSIDRKVRQLIAETVRERMGPFGLREVDVTVGEDHDGEPIFLIDAEYALSDRPIDPKLLSELTTDLRDRLWDLGEQRFPHIHHKFADGQKVAGYR